MKLIETRRRQTRCHVDNQIWKEGKPSEIENVEIQEGNHFCAVQYGVTRMNSPGEWAIFAIVLGKRGGGGKAYARGKSQS